MIRKKKSKGGAAVLALLLCGAVFCRAELAFEERVWRETAGVGQDKVPFVFPFTNEGENEVTITGIESSCGCTTAGLEKRTYAPGESGEITGEFRIGSRQGTQRKTVRVETDSVARPQILLTIEVEIPRLLSLEPGMVLWRKGDEPGVKAIRLRPNKELGVEIEEVSTDAGSFSLELLEPEDGSDEGGEVLVSVHSTDEATRGLIKITASLPDGTEKAYFAHALVR